MIGWLLACVPPPVDAETREELARMALPEELPPPSDGSAVVDEDAAIALGRSLYVAPLGCAEADPDCGSPSCQSCHALCVDDGRLCADPLEGAPSGADDVAFTPQAVGATGRNVPTVVNTVFRPQWGWAGRFCSLGDQIAFPILKPDVVVPAADADPEVAEALPDASWGDETFAAFWAGTVLPRVADRVRLHHAAAYEAAFGAPPGPTDAFVFDRAVLALEAFVRTLVVRDTPLDAFLAGDDDALEPAALRGAELFVGKGHCAACHRGPLLSDGRYHNVGVLSDDLGRAGPDGDYCGREEEIGPELAGSFQTPSLRHVGATGPWMHDGSFSSLWEVVAHYDLGGERSTVVGTQDPRVRPLGLDAGERADLEAFLRALGPR